MGLGNAGRSLIDGNTSWDAAAAPAVPVWNNVTARLDFTSVLASPVPSSGDRVNTVAFSKTVFGDAFGSSTLAVTTRIYSGSTTVEADILFNRNVAFDSYRGPLRYGSDGYAIGDIRRVFIHELGHALGLDHPDQHHQTVDAIMNSRMSARESLAPDDINGAQYIYGAAAPTPTPSPTPTSGGPSRLSNISTRLRVGTGDDVMIAGFMVRGSQSKTVIVRALGPALGSFGVANCLPDPTLELHNSAGVLIASNDDWETGTQVSQLTASGLAPPNGNESALIATLPPGSYTAIVAGYNGATGVGLAEVYQNDTNSSRLANISTRGKVGVGDEVLVGGLMVQGATPKKVVLRAIGPSLIAYGVSGTLADPVLELHNASGTVLATNDDWVSGGQTTAITNAGYAPGNSKEAAILTTMTAGNYTAIVRGSGNSTGIALFDAYDLDP